MSVSVQKGVLIKDVDGVYMLPVSRDGIIMSGAAREVFQHYPCLESQWLDLVNHQKLASAGAYYAECPKVSCVFLISRTKAFNQMEIGMLLKAIQNAGEVLSAMEDDCKGVVLPNFDYEYRGVFWENSGQVILDTVQDVFCDRHVTVLRP